MTSSEPFSPEDKGTSVRLEAGTVSHSNLVMEHDLKTMDSMDPMMSKAGIFRANPASICKEETLAMPLYREMGPIVPEMHEIGYVGASQEEVKSSVLNFVRRCLFFQERGEKLLPQNGQNHR